MFLTTRNSYDFGSRINRLLNDALPGFDWQAPEAATTAWVPAVDVFEQPDNIRIVDPEFPQSSVSDGAFNMPARPAIEISPLFLVMSAPSERRQSSVLAQSAPVEKLRSRVVPSARAASIA